MNDDRELKSLLEEWTVPGAPASLETRLSAHLTAAPIPWWRRAFTMMIPVPAPLALALSVLVGWSAWEATVAIRAACSAGNGLSQPIVQVNCAAAREC